MSGKFACLTDEVSIGTTLMNCIACKLLRRNDIDTIDLENETLLMYIEIAKTDKEFNYQLLASGFDTMDKDGHKPSMSDHYEKSMHPTD